MSKCDEYTSELNKCVEQIEILIRTSGKPIDDVMDDVRDKLKQNAANLNYFRRMNTGKSDMIIK